MADTTIPNERWERVGRVIVTHGYCHSNIKTSWYQWPELTPEMIAYLVSMVIFTPKMEVEAIGYDEHTGGFTLINKLDFRYHKLKDEFTEANSKKIERAKREVERREQAKAIGDMILADKKKNRENVVLREAARIIVSRTQENPGSVDIKLVPGRPEMVKLTAYFHDGTE